MLWKLSIFYSEIGDGTYLKHGEPYGRKIIMEQNMYAIVYLVFGFIVCCIQVTSAETEYFPGLRKPPQIPNWSSSTPNENAYLLAQLSNIIEEQARRRFQLQLQQQQIQQQQKHYHGQSENGAGGIHQEIAAPGFTYQFPTKTEKTFAENIPFAVSPADPRYYESSENLSDQRKMQSTYEEDYQELLAKEDEAPIQGSDGVPSYKLRAPMEVRPKILSDKTKSTDIMTREDLKSLVEKLQKNGQEGAIINNGQYLKNRVEQDMITKTQLEMDAAMGMYVVALIAGVSAAVTVGLIALGIGWYTLHKKGMAAADVEYPAYGVTGPNKDISPSGDRRLAQSAQMYHYQHQKQQIIAMENRSTGERNGSLSDVESDDENEEGDYTVYECPGLAPTGEMEVKNPLFLDDPTPASNATQQQQKSTGQNPKTNTTSNTPTPNNKNTKPSEKK